MPGNNVITVSWTERVTTLKYGSPGSPHYLRKLELDVLMLPRTHKIVRDYLGHLVVTEIYKWSMYPTLCKLEASKISALMLFSGV